MDGFLERCLSHENVSQLSDHRVSLSAKLIQVIIYYCVFSSLYASTGPITAYNRRKIAQEIKVI